MTEPRRRLLGRTPVVLIGFLLGLALTLVGWAGLARAHAGVQVSHRQQQTPHGFMPVDVYQASGVLPAAPAASAAPAVIVVHGFAASKELMRPFGYYLARQGYRAYLVDVSGHGHHAGLLQRMGAPADITALVDSLVSAGEAAPGRVALVGHSMGTYIVTETARSDPRIAATVVLSSITDQVEPGRPPAYLMLTAERDIAGVRDTFGKVMGRVQQGPARSPQAVADIISSPTAAVAAVGGLWIPGRNHITILYDRGALEAMARWLGRSLFGAAAPAPTDPARDLSLGWAFTLLTGLVLLFLALAVGLSRWFPGYSLRGTAAPRPYLWPLFYLLAGLVAIGPASLVQPLSFLHLLVSDYAAFYLVVVVALLEAARRVLPVPLIQSAHSNLDLGQGRVSLLYGALLFAVFFALLAPALSATLTNALPGPNRLWRAAVLVPLVVPFFLIDENIKAAVQTRYGGWVALGLSLLGKLAVAATWVVALKLPRAPFFLIIAMPVLLGVFVLMDGLTTLLFGWRRESMSLGLFKGLVFTWLLAVSFPLGLGF
ncbi:MAG: alpha/beta hydrolase [Symbiobacteriia bacterium]